LGWLASDSTATATALLSIALVAGCQGGAPFYTTEADAGGYVSVLPVTVGPGDKISVSTTLNAAERTNTFEVLTGKGADVRTLADIAIFGPGGFNPRPDGGGDGVETSGPGHIIRPSTNPPSAAPGSTVRGSARPLRR
jgi:hypothetical protein